MRRDSLQGQAAHGRQGDKNTRAKVWEAANAAFWKGQGRQVHEFTRATGTCTRSSQCRQDRDSWAPSLDEGLLATDGYQGKGSFFFGDVTTGRLPVLLQTALVGLWVFGFKPYMPEDYPELLAFGGGGTF